MPKTRNILNTFRVEVAVGNRKCHSNSKHSIEVGEKHFAYDKSPGERVNICKQCAPAIFEVAEKHLAEVRKELGV